MGTNEPSPNSVRQWAQQCERQASLTQYPGKRHALKEQVHGWRKLGRDNGKSEAQPKESQWLVGMEDSKWIPPLLILSLLMVAGAVAAFFLDELDWGLWLTAMAALIALCCLVRLLTNRPPQDQGRD